MNRSSDNNLQDRLFSLEPAEAAQPAKPWRPRPPRRRQVPAKQELTAPAPQTAVSEDSMLTTEQSSSLATIAAALAEGAVAAARRELDPQ